MNSGLYECTVMHRRLAPEFHEFVYRIFLFAIDLDELSEITAKTPLLGYNSPNLYSFHDTDHFQVSEGSARANAEAFLANEGITEKPRRILLVTNLRVFGYTFNPISIWFCYGEGEQPLGAIAEVGNTFGELKPYFVPFHDGTFHLRVPKYFYVSPFSDLDWEFDFRFRLPSENLGVYIDDYHAGQKMLITTLAGKRVELSSSNLVLFTFKYPLMTLRVIFLIHWQALRLWAKRLPWWRKEERGEMQRNVFRPHESLSRATRDKL